MSLEISGELPFTYPAGKAEPVRQGKFKQVGEKRMKLGFWVFVCLGFALFCFEPSKNLPSGNHILYQSRKWNKLISTVIG